MTSITIRDAAGVARLVSALHIRDGSNVSQAAEAVYIRATGNASELVFNPSGSITLAVTSTPNLVSASVTGTGTATTDLTTATATGGTAPYTYAWTLTSYTGTPPPTANAPSINATAFTKTGMSPSEVDTSNWLVTATDANSNTATAIVTANFASF